MKKYWILISTLCLCACGGKISTDKEETGWQKETSGVWTMSVGTPEKVNLLSELHITPKMEAIQKMGEADLPISEQDITTEVVDGKTYIRFPLEKDEKIFGLGLNFKTVEQRGRIMRLHVDHYGGTDDGRTHAPVPFFVSSRGYGALINSARYIDVWCGTSVRKDSKNPPVVRDRNTDKQWAAQPYSDNLEFLVPAEGVEIVLFGGPTMLDVVRRFNLYNGGGALPPKWGLGFWHRVPTLFSDKEVNEEVAEFEKRGFPLSVIGLEPGWMSRSYPCTYEWDATRFPDPEGFVKGLNEKHIKTNVWINPYVSPDGELYKKIEPYTGSHTVWCGIVPDYSLLETKKIMTDHFKKHQLDKGVSGSYGGVWSTNASDSTAPNKITSTNNRWAPTIFAYEDVDPSNGISDGYSDAKISSYNLSTTGVNEQLTDDQRNSYSYEKYNEDPGLKAVYNAYWGSPNRNKSQASTGTSFWLSSRCVNANWNNANFNFRYMSGSGTFSTANVFNSNTGINSYCYALRPVLQVSK